MAGGRRYMEAFAGVVAAGALVGFMKEATDFKPVLPDQPVKAQRYTPDTRQSQGSAEDNAREADQTNTWEDNANAYLEQYGSPTLGVVDTEHAISFPDQAEPSDPTDGAFTLDAYTSGFNEEVACTNPALAGIYTDLCGEYELKNCMKDGDLSQEACAEQLFLSIDGSLQSVPHLLEVVEESERMQGPVQRENSVSDLVEHTIARGEEAGFSPSDATDASSVVVGEQRNEHDPLILEDAVPKSEEALPQAQEESDENALEERDDAADSDAPEQAREQLRQMLEFDAEEQEFTFQGFVFSTYQENGGVYIQIFPENPESPFLTVDGLSLFDARMAVEEIDSLRERVAEIEAVFAERGKIPTDLAEQLERDAEYLELDPAYIEEE